MAKNNKNLKHSKKIRNLVVICLLLAIMLSVSTYAWFIGMKTVNVEGFDIKIATTEGLFLSMDGEHWSYTLDVNEADVYDGNTNTFADDGLIPMSSVGDMDSTSSTMKLFEKASMTAIPNGGGYRFLASRVNNYTNQGGKYNEGEGYVAFDLFIKNMSGEEYYPDNEPLNEEAIYLTTNSAVTYAADGGVANTGIENSIRVAFAQIGRVEAEIDTTEIKDNITAITCADVPAEEETQVQVTGICRDATIWEPNDTDHVQNAINWYNEGCLARTGEDVFDSDSYTALDESATTTNCKAVQNGTPYKTYAISRELGIADNVNIYDGEYNSYMDNVTDYSTYTTAKTAEEGEFDENDYKLVSYDYFTDTMKDKTSTDRPVFMTLAPNSITKVRVYIYLEGQDIDNYDFASLGKAISINFGFTKERYTEGDVDYTGPSTDLTTVPYTATGEITEISDSEITYSKTYSSFTLPRSFETDPGTFTFKDGEQSKTATFEDGHWTIS